MKLIYIANNRIPTPKANGKQIFKTCEALAKNISLELWLPDRKQPPEFRDRSPFDYYGVAPCFPLKKLFTIDFLLAAQKSPPVFQHLAYYLQELSFLFSLALNKPNCDVVYSRSLTAALLAKFMWKVRSYYEIHNLTTSSFSLVIQKYLYRKLDGLVVISFGLANKLQGLKILVAPDGVDLSEFQSPKKFFLKKSPVLYVGSLEKRKGASDLLAASKNIPRQVVIIGDGPVGKFKNTSFLGFVPPREIPGYLTSASVLVLPNSAYSQESSHYTSPMKLFEYLAAGVPIVATNTSANKEILTENSAYFVLPDNPQSLSEGINHVLKDKKLASRLAKNARKLAKHYTWDKRAAKISNFLKLT